MRSILELPAAHKRLSPSARRRFDAIYTFDKRDGRLRVPESMKAWATRQFGSVAKLERQPILRITNRVTYEGALFNKLRADRPMQRGEPPSRKELLEKAAKEPFANPEEKTPEDTFGRVYGRSELTASNVAKYDALHGLVIFNEADPLAFSAKETADHFDAAMAWVAAMREEHDASHPVIAWNCLWKAAASLVHGHMQVLLGYEQYAWLAMLHEQSKRYRRRERRDYFDDLSKVHESLGLAKRVQGHRIMAHLTPRKEKELLILSPQVDATLAKLVHKALQGLLKLGVESFNLITLPAPLDGSWRRPVITRIVDRGPLESRTTDIGVTELYLNQNVVASDPAKLWRKLRV